MRALPPSLPTTWPRTSGPATSRVFVLVLDAIHVASPRTRVVRAYARQFIERHVGPADLVAVVSPGGLTSATQDFTSDKARLLAAVDQFAGNKLASATVEIERETDGRSVPLHNGMDPSDGERANRAKSLTNVLEALAVHLGRVESRRKSLLLFSEGVDYDMMDIMGKLQRQSSDVMKAMDRAIGALMRSNVSLYAIDPRALSSAEGDLVENPLYRETPSVTQSSVEAEYSDSIRGLRHVADSTGGFAAVDRNDIGPAFERIIEESSEYLRPWLHAVEAIQARRVSGHRRPRVASGAPRRCAQRLPRALRCAARAIDRRGCRGDAALDHSWPAAQQPGRHPGDATTPARSASGVSAELSVLLASPLPRAGLPIRVQAVPFRGSGRKAAVRLVVEVLGRSLAFAERSGRFEERIDLALLTVDDRARAGNGRSATIDVRVDAGRAPAGEGHRRALAGAARSRAGPISGARGRPRARDRRERNDHLRCRRSRIRTRPSGDERRDDDVAAIGPHADAGRRVASDDD